LKVSINSKNLEDQPKLIEGLKKLNKSDPSVEIYSHENGDIILGTCGEVHL
jgi:translation elongation factor EF-G